MPSRIRYIRLLSLTNQVATQLQGLHFPSFQSASVTWQPAANVYVHADRLEVCLELAGVNKADIEVSVEPHRLMVRGHRDRPENQALKVPGQPERCGRMLVMEIADGDFSRVIELPVGVDTDRVTARHENGWLWITLPRLLQNLDKENQ